MSRKHALVTLTGPSCAGKTTLEGLLKAEGFVSLTSTTTRTPREGEVDGQHYHFVDDSMFRRLETQGAFIESVKFGGNRYGLCAAELKRAFEAEHDAVLVCEPIGLRQIAAWAKQNDVLHIAVYVDNPPQVIAERFLKRAGIDVAEAMLHKDPAAAAAVVNSYARRLAEMLSTEQSWPALASGDDIDVYAPVLNQDNQKSVVRVIKAHVYGYEADGVRPIQQVAA